MFCVLGKNNQIIFRNSFIFPRKQAMAFYGNYLLNCLLLRPETTCVKCQSLFPGKARNISPADLLPITYKCIQLQLQLLCNFMITDYNYKYIFPECNQLQVQLRCNVIDYNYNYFLVVPCLKKNYWSNSADDELVIHQFVVC